MKSALSRPAPAAFIDCIGGCGALPRACWSVVMDLKAQGSHPIDRHVGARMRLRRMELRLSQSTLGAKLGVTFQAVQKYEGGVVRISASRLYDLAQALGTTPAFFFEG